MFEGVVATILNRYLGKYIQDLDTENLNIGIFSGNVQLTELRLKPEALYELDIPIEVKVGTIGRISLSIPWTGLYTQSVTVTVEDVFVITGPVIDRPYDSEKDKRLIRAAKKKKLEDLEGESLLGTAGPPDAKTFLENLVTTVINNLQIYVRNVHIRYEDTVTNAYCSVACGVCIQSISVETTNNKWKPSIMPQGASSLYHLIRMESFSIYLNPSCGTCGLVTHLVGAGSTQYCWRNELRRGLETFSINKEDFDFIVKPITAKMKIIVNKSNEARVPKLLVDFVLQDAATQLSRQQYLSIIGLTESFQRMSISRNFRQFHPGVPVSNNTPKWWKYAYDSVLEQRVRPYSWKNIKTHREHYRNYKNSYKKTLLSPNDTELKLDLQVLEDQLGILDIVVAREHAKIELHHEDPEHILVRENEAEWWDVLGQEKSFEMQVQTEKDRGLWAQLSLAERKKLCEVIGYVEGAVKPEKPKQYTEHKFNFTLANCTLSLVNHRSEVLVMTLTQFLASLETRPSAEAFKISARAESFVVEGASMENDLIPMVTADNILSGNTSTNFLAIDFEKHPLNCEADFGIAVSLEPVEIVYHEHAVSEIINFFQTRSMTLQDALEFSKQRMPKANEVGNILVEYAIARHKTIDVNMDLKGPYFVIPELGSTQKGGSIVVVDFGRVTIKSDLQSKNIGLEDATQMELEERLYDRLHVDLSDLQLLFCDSGEEWRDARKLQDTDYHLVPKIRCQVVFSNSVKPEYRQLPRHKLNISISSLKLNLSDRKIGMVLDFLDNLPLPSPNTLRVSEVDSVLEREVAEDKNMAILLNSDKILPEFSSSQLLRVKRSVVMAEMSRRDRKSECFDKTAAKVAMLEVEKSCILSDHSDEEYELWARTVDLPGFDDNVSPHNAITMLLRIIVGEVVLQLARSNNRVDKPYLMLQVSKICWDTALMQYGPAVQASIGGIHLIDKIHTGCSGEYLELISTDSTEDMMTVLYRKVRANCPDFKSHFHNVEQSLVLDFTSVSVVFHREAFSTLNKYLQYLLQKVQTRDTHLQSIVPVSPTVMTWLFAGEADPPIPPGATKFSYSTRLGEVKVKLCDTDMDILEVKVAGLESDCMFKANERMVLRIYLTAMSVDDLSDMTLYPKVLTIEEDKLFDFKYVRHSPRLYTQSDLGSNKDDVKSDGSLRLHVGRIHVVLLYKLIVDLQHFMEPFIHRRVPAYIMNTAEKSVERQIEQLRGWSTRLHLSLDFHAPTLLLPQKSASPNLIIMNMGDLSVENFFKEVTHAHLPYVVSGSSSSVLGEVPVVDNVLVRLESVQVSRAVMTLAGSLEIQEPILEPVSVRFDVKRMVAYHHTINSLPPGPGPYLQLHRDLLLYDVVGGVEIVQINLGQRDLSTILSVWSENLAEGGFMDMQSNSDSSSPIEPPTPTNPAEDPAVKKLQAFFCQSEQVRRESSVRLSLDGLQLYLFNDMDEVLSSPVRDLNHGLCKLDIGEASLSVDTFTDQSLELKMALQSCLLEDIRPDNSITIRKIFQSHSGETKMDSSPISVSTPPIIDVTFKQTQSGDRCIDVLVEKTRLNFSVPFFMNLGRFLMDSFPAENPTDRGIVNHGYIGDLGVQSKAPVETLKPVPQRPPSSADSTSGYFSSGASYVDDQAGLSVSVQLRKPEIMLFADLSEHNGHALLLRTEFLIDYSHHPGRDSLVCSLAGLQILSKLQGHNRQPPHLVLHPCDIEFVKSFKSVEDGLKMTATVSTIDVHLSASAVHTVSSVIEDIRGSLQAEETEPPTRSGCHNTDSDDLWSPKKIQPYIFPETCESLLYGPPAFPEGRPRQTFTVAVPKIRVVFEFEDGNHRTPVLLFKSSAEASVNDWSKQMHMKAEIQMQASYYNDRVGAWEPLIEPCVEEENVYRPWEMLVKVFQAKAFPISSRLDHDTVTETDNSRVKVAHRSLRRKAEESETSADETEPENGMTFIRRHNIQPSHVLKRTTHENVSLIGYPDDSDSENEEGVLEKLAGAMGHLVTGDSSDGEASESEDSSGAEPSVETEEASEITMSCGSTVIGRDERAVFLKKQNDSMDSGLETEAPDQLATYIMMDARDRLNITLTPAALQVLHNLATVFTRGSPDIPAAAFHGLETPLSLENDLGPWAKIILLSRAEMLPDGKDRVVMTAWYNKSDSLPSSPASTSAGLADLSPTDSDIDIESFEGGFNTHSSEGTTGQELFSPVLRFPGESVTKLYKKVTDERLLIEVEGFDKLQVVVPQRLVSKLHMLHPTKNSTRYYVVVNVDVHMCHRKISVRSPLQVKNETSYAMGLYYKKSVLDALGVEHVGESTNPFEDTIRVAIVEPDETFSVPLYVAYHCKLFILPAYVDSYHVSETGLWWQELASDLNTPKDIHCSPKEEKDATVFSVRALCVEGAPMNRASRSIPNYLIRILPPLAMHNRLPYAIEVKVPTIKYEVRIEAGEKTNVYFLNLLKMHKICVEVPVYLGIPWMGSFNLTADLEEKTVAMATEYDTEGGNKQLGLSLRVERTETCDVFLHAPYWIINKTGLPLQIRASLSDVVYEAQGEEPLLFCYKKHRRHCVRLRAYHSSWSSAFSLDTVGCTGLVVCKDRERKRRYRILLTVILSKLCPHLTRIVTLLPNFLVVNDTRKHLRFMEENERADLWIDLAPGQCVPFWPDTDSMRMYVKYRDSKLVSQHFPVTHIHQTVLRMDKGQAGLCVDVSGGGEQPFTVTFRCYCLGDAPVRVDNLCEDLFLKIHQQDLGQVVLLSPYQTMLYTWDDPSKERSLLWNVYNKKSKGFIAEFWKDGYGQERVSFHTVKQPSVVTSTPTVTAKLSASLKRITPKSPVQDGSSSSDDTESDEQKPQSVTFSLKKTRKDKVTVYWVSYLEGSQRVLLFTQDERVAYQARSNVDAEKSNMELFVSLSGIGMSLALESNYCQKELAYVSITDSSPLWEVMVAHRWKLLTLELASWIEDKWRQDQKKAQMKDYVHVDFEKMQMTKPFYGDLRRRHYPGLWLQYRKSDQQSYLHCKLHRLQVDNQLHDAVFPTVLYPTPVPQHIVRRMGMKPCIELAVMKRHRPAQNQDVYKFIKVLVQEFSMQLDKGFLLSVYDILSNWQVEEKSSVRIRADIALVHIPIATIAAKTATDGPKVMIEYLHLSPLTLQFSFSPRGTVYQKHRSRSFKSDVVDFFLNSFGATLTEVKGVKLKMAYLEQKGSLISLSQHLTEVYRHYSSQLIQQFYVLVLGLDVLGNPYGLITDFTEGFGDFFYEPFLGVMEGPDEFADGLSYGARSLLGHVVGGTAGSISLISSSLGGLLSSLSFDEDYKKRRRFCLHQASDLPETILQASKSFVMGVALGLSGVIMKPIIGAQQDGVEGFFKGVGKGLMGLISKPAGGVLDSIAMALDGIKRAAEMGEDVVMRARLPRYMNPYTGLRPFSVYEATGLHLLNTLSKSHYSDSDIYWAHAALSKEAKVNVLISLQHVFLVEKCRLWGTWDVEWVVRIDDIMAVPHIADKKLVFKVRQDESCNFLSGDERYVECEDMAVLEWLQKKIETVMILNMEDKPCPSEV